MKKIIENFKGIFYISKICNDFSLSMLSIGLKDVECSVNIRAGNY